MRRLWRQFLQESEFIRHYLWKYRALIGVGLFALLLVDCLEILPPIFLKNAIDVVVEHKPLHALLTLALAYLGVALIQSVCRYGWRMYLIRASLLAGRDIRSRFGHHLFGLAASFFDRSRIGDLMSLATNDVEAVRMAIGNGVLVFADAFFYFATVPVAMYFLSPKLTLIAFLPLPIIPFLVLRNEREIHVRFGKVQESFSRLSALAQEGLSGIRVIKAFAKEDVQNRRFQEEGKEYVRLSLRLARVQSAFGPTLDFTMSTGLVLLLYLGGKNIIGGGAAAITLGTFVAFQRYIQKMVWPMAALGMAVSMYQRSSTSSARLKEILSVSTDVPESKTPRLPADYPETPSAPWRTQGKVELRKLSFHFPGSDRDALREISLTIAPGERIAFVGMIGSGKSALLSLLPRLYPLAPGMLFIDDIDVNDWPLEELRRQVGYVSQEVFLFSESVAENVAFGLHEWVNATRVTRVEDATSLASVHEDVLGFTDSYRTRLGERGVNLSGGQKQRLTIARALAKQPSILVLDDALSSVDVRTEEKILKGLRSRAGRNTELIAAHRISTVRDADRIAVLENGKIRQLGTHAELLRDRMGLYRGFYEQQQLKEELENYVEALEQAETPVETTT